MMLVLFSAEDEFRPDGWPRSAARETG